MNKKRASNPRLGTVGGQAVMEGVMMKSKSEVAIAVRRMDDKKIVVRTKKYRALKEKCAFFRVPVIRGIVNFIDMMRLSFSTLTASTEMLGLEEEGEPSRFEKWLDRHFGKSIMAFASALGVVLGVALAVFLFIFLPVQIVTLVENAVGDIGWWRNLAEGALKMLIFVLYLFAVSLIPDIKRVFMYHGAEHKSIFCYENGLELTVENVKKQRRFHPRCGTSFLFVIIIVSILVNSLIVWDQIWIRTVMKIVLLPVVVGLGYEYIMYAGRHDNPLTRVLSAPGLWMQRITTKEPDDSQMEVAIVSIKSALPEEFPDFEIPFEEPADSAEQSANGGEQSANGGEQSADGGEQSADGGEQSANGGEQSADGGEAAE